MLGQTQAKGAVITYETDGNGPPLLLIAGLGAGRWMWGPQVKGLAPRFTVIAFDNRGIGGSPREPGPLNIRMMAEDAIAVLDALQVRRAHVAGASMGGFIAQTVASLWPDRVDRLILCCTAGRGFGQVWPSPSFLRVLGFDSRSGRLAPRRLGAFFGDRFQREHPDEVERWARIASDNMPSYRLLWEQLIASARFNMRGETRRIGRPTLVIHGTADRVIPVSNGRRLASEIPGARLVLVEGAGHGVMIERADLVNQEIEKFLSAAPAAQPSAET